MVYRACMCDGEAVEVGEDGQGLGWGSFTPESTCNYTSASSFIEFPLPVLHLLLNFTWFGLGLGLGLGL